MKLKNFLYIAATFIAAGLNTACSFNEPEGPDGGEQVQAYMSLQLTGTQNAMKSRTEGGSTEVDSPEESKITEVLVLLCDTIPPHTVKFKYSLSLLDDDFTAVNDGVVTKPFKVEVGTYDVFVVANPPNDFLTISDSSNPPGTDISVETIEEINSQGIMQGYFASDGTFVMFNECHGNSPDDIKGARVTISSTNDYNHPAQCPVINLDRLAAKITSDESTNLNIDGIKAETQNNDGLSFVNSVTLNGFKLLNGIKKVYLQQRWERPSKEASTGGNGTAWCNMLITPESNIGDTITNCEYFNSLYEFRDISIGATSGGTTVRYTQAKDCWNDVFYYSSHQDKPKEPIYIMENSPTCAGNKAQRGNTTGLIYQFQCVVDGSDNMAGENCFYGYAGKYYPSLAAIENKHKGLFKNVQIANGDASPGGLTQAENELRAAFTADDTVDEEKVSDFRVKYNIKVYSKGIMYYTHYIKDANYENADHERYYSVMRNTWYQLTVGSLLRIGNDIPGGWEPGTNPRDNVDNTDVYMVVNVNVNPWVLSVGTIELK